MDSAEEIDIHRILRQQGTLLVRQQELITASCHTFSDLSLQLTHLTERLDQFQILPPATPVVQPPSEPETAASRHAEPRLNPPARYSGEPHSCRYFLSQCSLFHPSPPVFPRSDIKWHSPSRMPPSLDRLVDLTIRVDKRIVPGIGGVWPLTSSSPTWSLERQVTRLLGVASCLRRSPCRSGEPS